MKKSFFLILAVIFITFSCTKEENSNINNNDAKSQNHLKGQTVIYTLLNPYNPPEMWCKYPSYNCLPVVVITGKQCKDFYEEVSQGPEFVANYFNGTQWKDLFSYLENDDLGISFLEKLRSGNYLIERLGFDETGNRDILIAKNVENEKDFFGLPFKIEE